MAYDNTTTWVNLALAILRRGEPLPVDLTFKLIELGIDVDALSNRFDV